MGPAEPYWMSSLICKQTIYSQVAASPPDPAAVLVKALCIRWWFWLTGPRRSHLWPPLNRWKEGFQLCHQTGGSKGDCCLTPGLPCRSPPSRNRTGISEWMALTPNCTSVGQLWKVEPGAGESLQPAARADTFVISSKRLQIDSKEWSCPQLFHYLHKDVEMSLLEQQFLDIGIR